VDEITGVQLRATVAEATGWDLSKETGSKQLLELFKQTWQQCWHGASQVGGLSFIIHASKDSWRRVKADNTLPAT
jgi:hypothetical protein